MRKSFTKLKKSKISNYLKYRKKKHNTNLRKAKNKFKRIRRHLKRSKKNFKFFKYFLNESRAIVRKIKKKRRKKKSLVFLIKYLLLKIATKNINFIKIKLRVKNIFISFYRRLKGLFVKATCGLYGFTGAKKSTTFAYEHTALFIGKEYFKKTYTILKYKNIRDKLSNRRKKRKACVIYYCKTPLFFNLQHHINRRQIRSIIRGFKKSKIGITFLSYNPKSAHNGLWLRKKKRV